MTAADRARRAAVWAAAVVRVPTSTPPTVPWVGTRGSTSPPVPAEACCAEPGAPSPGTSDIGRSGEVAGLGTGAGGASDVGPGAGGATVVPAAWVAAGRWAAGKAAEAARTARLGPDPAKKHAKRLRRTRRSVQVRSMTAGGLGAVSLAAYPAMGLEPAVLAGGGLAAVVAGSAALAGIELRRLRRLPAPALRPARPPHDSPARGPLDRLATQENVLRGLLVHLGDAADEPGRVATAAAHGLRELGVRLTAVDRAHRAAGGLEHAVAALAGQLHAGLAAFDALVVAAADAVAADAGLRAPVSLREATDTLAGLAAGLRDVAA